MQTKVADDRASTISRPFGSIRPLGRTTLTSDEDKTNADTMGGGTANTGDSDDDCVRPSTPPLTSMSGADEWSLPRNVNDIWHRPTLAQISEALYVALMNKSPHESLPAEYDAYVRQLVEGYTSLSKAIRAAEQSLAEEKETKERSMDEFARRSRDWEQREAAYKAEIRRMEVLLAKSAPDGVEAVLVARSGSIVDRSEKFKAQMQKARGVSTAGRPPSDHPQYHYGSKARLQDNETGGVLSPRHGAILGMAQKVETPRAVTRGHGRTFSFNPGEDELDLPTRVSEISDMQEEFSVFP